MMSRRTAFGALVAGLAGLSLSGCGSKELRRYKMTVEVETPQGLRSGFAVREIVVTLPPSIPMLGEDKGSKRVRGEAVAVDLPGGRTLFALLSGANGNVDYAAHDIDTLLNEHDAAAPNGVVELWPAMPKTKAPKIGNPLPLLVTFNDIADPASVTQLEPENLSATYGADVRLSRITIERTSDPVTGSIDKRLPWIDDYYDKMLDGNHVNISSALPNRLSTRDFKAGVQLR